MLNQAANFRNEIRYTTQQMETLEKRQVRVKEAYEQDQAKLQATVKKKEQLMENRQLLQNQLDEIRTDFKKQTEHLEHEKHMLHEIESTLQKWQQQYGAWNSKYEALKDMQADYEGYLYGVKEVLKAGRANKLKGIFGAVAELIHVPEKIEIAIETALGGALQHIVTRDEASARAAISYLKQRRFGRATFLPLEVMKPRVIGAHERRMAEQTEGFVGIGAELVSSESKFSNIVSYLLGNVLITETLEQANRVAATCQYRYRVVTLEGDVVNAGGSMSGGSLQRKGSGLLGRQRQLEEIEQQMDKAKEQMNQIEKKATSMRRSLRNRTEQIERLKREEDECKIDLTRLEAEVKQLRSESDSVQSRFQLVEQELNSIQDEWKELQQSKKTAELQLNQVQAKEQQIQKLIQTAENERKKRESAKNVWQAKLTDLKVAHASISREKEAIEDHFTRLNKDKATLQAEWRSNKQALDQVKAALEKTKQEKVTQIQKLNELKLKKEECSNHISFMRADKAQREADLQKKENETKEQRQLLKETEEKLHQTEVKVSRLDVQLDHLLKSLADDYEISFELAKQRYGVPEDVAEAEKQVKALKREIANLGEVNLGSMDEFERVSERHAFLLKQYEDLVEAKNNLGDVIREMEKEMSQRFKTAFAEIRSHFSVVFQQLFGGGRADLVLTDPENLLETGIDIVAQPPGKKLQNLQLLSGGERALTAIALLFAILNVKPVPFCVLDEVEAALDEANVTRFAKYLREFSDTTQFIVITHRKGTMEEADVLYGVTMEEDGVSKLVSVKLDEDSEMITA